MRKPSNHPFPDVIGNEFETSVNFGYIVSYPDHILEGEFVDEVEQGLPKRSGSGLASSPPLELYTGTQFLTNGFKYYDGSLGNDYHHERVEIATPETVDPDQLTVYARAGELILSNSVVEFMRVANGTQSDRIASARIQKRVIDSYGNTWACHDNFGYVGKDYKSIAELRNSYSLNYFLGSRPLLTGSGAVTCYSYLLSQKVSSLNAITAYGFNSRLYRFTQSPQEVTGRIEISCSDYNVLDWPTRVRVGGVALLLAAKLVGAIDNIEDRAADMTGNSNILSKSRSMNALSIEEDGKFKLTPEQIGCIDFQQFVAQTAVNRMANLGIDIPPVYLNVAKAIDRFCTDIKRANQSGTVYDIADRAEWANRFSYILSKMEKERNKGIKRDMFDYRARRDDLAYDATLYTVYDDFIQIDHSVADEKMKRRGLVADTVSSRNVEAAYKTAPATRAKTRSDLIQKHEDMLVGVDWQSVSYFDSYGGIKQTVLPNALTS